MADISAPNAGAYGIWGPQYAAALAAQSGSPVAGPLNMLALASRAAGEGGAYSQDLMTTQGRQLELARMEADAKMQEALINQMAPLAAAGATGYAHPVMQQFGIIPNAQAGGAIDAAQLQETAATVFDRRAGAVADLAAAGVMPSVENVNDTLLPTDPSAPLPEYQAYMTPGDISDRTTADARMKSAEADMVSARQPRSGGGGGGSGQTTEIRMTPNALTGQMEPTIVVRRAGADLINQYMPGGVRPTPESTGGARNSAQILENIRNRNR